MFLKQIKALYSLHTTATRLRLRIVIYVEAKIKSMGTKAFNYNTMLWILLERNVRLDKSD